MGRRPYYGLKRKALIAARGDIRVPDLAKVLGITRIHVYRVEAGDRDASPDLMVRWARALSADVAAIWPKQDVQRARRSLEAIEEVLKAVVA